MRCVRPSRTGHALSPAVATCSMRKGRVLSPSPTMPMKSMSSGTIRSCPGRRCSARWADCQISTDVGTSGRSPRRVTVHKTTEFKKDEIDGCLEALHLCEAVDLVQVVEDVGWRGVRIDRDRQSGKGKPTGYPVDRGTLILPGDLRVSAVDAWRCKRRRGAPVLPRRPQHAPSDLTGPSCRARLVERNRPVSSRAREDGLEQRRTVRLAAGDHGIRKNARARCQTNGRIGLRSLSISFLHVTSTGQPRARIMIRVN